MECINIYKIKMQHIQNIITVQTPETPSTSLSLSLPVWAISMHMNMNCDSINIAVQSVSLFRWSETLFSASHSKFNQGKSISMVPLDCMHCMKSCYTLVYGKTVICEFDWSKWRIGEMFWVTEPEWSKEIFSWVKERIVCLFTWTSINREKMLCFPKR